MLSKASYQVIHFYQGVKKLHSTCISNLYFSLTMICHNAPTILMHTRHKSHRNKLFKKEVVSSYQRESEMFPE